MANKMRYRWGPLVLNWVDKSATVDVEQGDMLKWVTGGTVTPCTTSADATVFCGIAMSASPTSDASGQSVRIAMAGYGAVFSFPAADSATVTVGDYFIITANQEIDEHAAITLFNASGTNVVCVCVQEAAAGDEVLVSFLPGRLNPQIRTV